jgi:tRNA(fMet)-specific endonuclease VapC
MAMIYLLDSNSWIAYLRRTNVGVIQRIQQEAPANIRLCSVVLAELFYGVFRSPPAFQAHNLSLLAQLIQEFASLPFEDRAAEEYGKIRADLAKKGTPIGPNDLMIAGIALANNLRLVTHNTSEFGRVVGLQLEDWHTP